MNMQGIALSIRALDQFYLTLSSFLICLSHNTLSARSFFWLLLPFLLGGCVARSQPQPKVITLEQHWALNPGDEIGNSVIAGSLGDVSLLLNGSPIIAPFNGELEPSEIDSCVFYSTPEIPAYLFRLCGLQNIRYGDIKAGKVIGKGQYLSFATLRRQPSGKWIIVEPAEDLLERALRAQ